MKTKRRMLSVVLTAVAVSLLTSHCTPTATDTAPPSDCRIQQSTSTIRNAGGEGTEQTQYEYDPAGNLTRMVKTLLLQTGTTGRQSTTSTDTYSYDANNVLTRKATVIEDRSVFAGTTTGSTNTTTTDYTYSNDRLTGYRTTNVNSRTTASGPQQPRTTTSTSQYTYDVTGQLIRQAIDNGQTITYQAGKVVAYTGVPFTVTDGLIVKAVFPGTQGTGNVPYNLTQLRQYDDQRRVIEHRELINDTLDRYNTYSWQAGRPAESSLPAFKGHPKTSNPYGETGLATEYRQFHVNRQQGDRPYETNRTQTVYQLNAQGYVTQSTATTTYTTNGQTQPDVVTTTYTYTNCN